MFILQFSKSKSPRFKEATDMAVKLGGTFDGETVTIQIGEKEKLLNLYGLLLPLISIIENWRSVKATIYKKRINPFRLMMVTKGTKECSDEHNGTPEYCRGFEPEGWGCKHIRPFARHLFEKQLQYKNNEKYWYNFGKFIKPDVWEVDKKGILTRLQDHVQKNCIDACPFYDPEKLKSIVSELPNMITIDNENWEKYYNLDFVGDKIGLVAVNIRHLSLFLPNDVHYYERKNKIKELKYKIGMGMLKGTELSEALLQLDFLQSCQPTPGPLMKPIASVQIVEKPKLQDIDITELENSTEGNQIADQIIEQYNKLKDRNQPPKKWSEEPF